MAQYDIILQQNVHATLLEYAERFVAGARSNLITFNGDAEPIALSPGANGQVLKSAGASGDLFWDDLEVGHTQNTDTGTNSLIFELDNDGFQIELTAESATKFGVYQTGGITYADIEAKDATFNNVTVVTAPTAGSHLTNKSYVDGVLVSDYVPYSGATQGLDLGSQTLAAGNTSITGDLDVTGIIVVDTHFRSSDEYLVLGTNSAGEIYIRPDKYDVTTNQSTFTTTLATIGTPMLVEGNTSITGYLTVSDTLTVDGFLLQNSAVNNGMLELNEIAGTAATGIRIKRDVGDQWDILGTDTEFSLWDNQNADYIFKYTQQAGVELFYNNTSVFKTVSGGAEITGDLEISSSLVLPNLAPVSDSLVLTVDSSGVVGAQAMPSDSYWSESTYGIGYSGGNVAIGATPSASDTLLIADTYPKIQLKSSHYTYDTQILFNAGNVGYATMGIDTSDSGFKINNGSSFASAPAIFIDGNNHVSIGAAWNNSPHQLYVSGDTWFNNNVYIGDLATSSGTDLVTVNSDGKLDTVNEFSVGGYSVLDYYFGDANVLSGATGYQEIWTYPVGEANMEASVDKYTYRLKIAFRRQAGSGGNIFFGIKAGNQTLTSWDINPYKHCTGIINIVFSPVSTSQMSVCSTLDFRDTIAADSEYGQINDRIINVVKKDRGAADWQDIVFWWNDDQTDCTVQIYTLLLERLELP